MIETVRCLNAVEGGKKKRQTGRNCVIAFACMQTCFRIGCCIEIQFCGKNDGGLGMRTLTTEEEIVLTGDPVVLVGCQTPYTNVGKRPREVELS